MKNKLFLYLSFASLIFASCSSSGERDEPIVQPEKKILLSKITTTYYDNPNNPDTSFDNLFYNDKGQLIKSVSGENRTATFEYDANGKPVKALYYNAGNALEYTSVYTYNGEELTNVKAVYDNSAYNRSYNLTYNNVGKLISSSLCQGENCNNPNKETYTYNGDNIITEINETTTVYGLNTKREFTYDDNLNPFTYTNRYHKIMMSGAYAMSKNNYITEKISYKDNNGNWIQNQTRNSTIQYNNDKLPTQVVVKDQNGNNVVQYNYEYTIK